jgi:hypothetical protein
MQKQTNVNVYYIYIDNHCHLLRLNDILNDTKGGIILMDKITVLDYIKLRDQGMNDNQIAQKYGVTRQAIGQFVRYHGIARKSDIVNYFKAKTDIPAAFHLLAKAKELTSRKTLESMLAANCIYTCFSEFVANQFLGVLRNCASIISSRISKGVFAINVPTNNWDIKPLSVNIDNIDRYEFPFKNDMMKLLNNILKIRNELYRKISMHCHDEIPANIQDELIELGLRCEELAKLVEANYNSLDEILFSKIQKNKTIVPNE